MALFAQNTVPFSPYAEAAPGAFPGAFPGAYPGAYPGAHYDVAVPTTHAHYDHGHYDTHAHGHYDVAVPTAPHVDYFPTATAVPHTLVEAWGTPIYKKKWLLGKWKYAGISNVKYVPRTSVETVPAAAPFVHQGYTTAHVDYVASPGPVVEYEHGHYDHGHFDGPGYPGAYGGSIIADPYAHGHGHFGAPAVVY